MTRLEYIPIRLTEASRSRLAVVETVAIGQADTKIPVLNILQLIRDDNWDVVFFRRCAAMNNLLKTVVLFATIQVALAGTILGQNSGRYSAQDSTTSTEDDRFFSPIVRPVSSSSTDSNISRYYSKADTNYYQEQEDLDLQSSDDPTPQRAEFGPWPRKGIRAISLNINESNEIYPEDRSEQLVNSYNQSWNQFAPAQKVFAWVPPNIKYQPLYFEDVALERYGQTASPTQQALLSGAHFFKSLALLGHQARHDHPYSCDHPLGFCRPGNTVPYTIQRQFFGRTRLLR